MCHQKKKHKKSEVNFAQLRHRQENTETNVQKLPSLVFYIYEWNLIAFSKLYIKY